MDLGVDFYDLVKCIVLKRQRGSLRSAEGQSGCASAIAKSVMREKGENAMSIFSFVE